MLFSCCFLSLFSLVGPGGGEGLCNEMLIDSPWCKMTKWKRSKALRSSRTYIEGLFRLVRLTFDLSVYKTKALLTFCPPPPNPPPPLSFLYVAMEVLVSELGVLLKMLDQENLSSTAQEKKTSVRNLLQQIQPSSGQNWAEKSVRCLNTSQGFKRENISLCFVKKSKTSMVYLSELYY